MSNRIGSSRPLRHFIHQWRVKCGLTQEQLAERLETSKATISRWETHERDINGAALQAVAEALGLGGPADLLRDPAAPSADQLLEGKPDAVRRQAIQAVKAIVDNAA